MQKEILEGPILRNLIKIALPLSIGFFFRTMYNVIDTYFAARISDDALSGISLTFPFFLIILTISIGFSAGISAIVGNELGKKEYKRASFYFAQSIVYVVIISIILFNIIMSNIFLDILNWITHIEYLDDDYLYVEPLPHLTYVQEAQSYLIIIYMGAILLILPEILSVGLNVQGLTKYTSISLIIATILNFILSPLLSLGIIPILEIKVPIPEFGVKGIAVATLISNFISFIFLLYVLKNKSSLLDSLSFIDFKPIIKVFKEITKQSVPSSLNFLAFPLFFLYTNYFITLYGASAVAAYGIGLRIEQMILIPVFAINVAVSSMISQNYGAGQIIRVRQIRITGMLMSMFILFLGGLSLIFFGEYVTRLFEIRNEEIVHLSVTYLFIEGFMLVAYGIMNINSGSLQAIKKPHLPMTVNLVRLLILPPIFYYILRNILDWGLLGIWWGNFFSVWCGAIMMFLIAQASLKKNLAS